MHWSKEASSLGRAFKYWSSPVKVPSLLKVLFPDRIDDVPSLQNVELPVREPGADASKRSWLAVAARYSDRNVSLVINTHLLISVASYAAHARANASTCSLGKDPLADVGIGSAASLTLQNARDTP